MNLLVQHITERHINMKVCYIEKTKQLRVSREKKNQIIYKDLEIRMALNWKLEQ